MFKQKEDCPRRIGIVVDEHIKMVCPDEANKIMKERCKKGECPRLVGPDENELRAIVACDQSDGALKKWAQEKLDEGKLPIYPDKISLDTDNFQQRIEHARKSTSCDYAEIVKDIATFGEDLIYAAVVKAFGEDPAHFIEHGVDLDIQAEKLLDEMASAVEQKLKIRCGCKPSAQDVEESHRHQLHVLSVEAPRNR